VNALHHISLSVVDLDRSAAWYRRVFALEEVMREDGGDRRAIVFRFAGSRLMIGLVCHAANDADPFTPSTTGLDHMAFDAGSREDLERWVEHLDALGVESSGIVEIPIGAIVNFRDPNGIQLAAFWERPAGDISVHLPG
jgi:glyoxylase I family protein